MAEESDVAPVPRSLSITAWLLGLFAVCIVVAAMDGFVVNAVNYNLEPLNVPRRIGPYVPHALTLLLIGWLLARRLAPRPADLIGGPGLTPRHSLLASAAPLLLPAVLAVPVWLATSPGYGPLCLVIIALSCAVDRLGDGLRPMRGLDRLGTYAPAVLLLAIAAATVWHTMGQITFWRHFMLGYADFGFFTTELENCLPWKDVGPLRFADTRMGYHAVFMFYALAPLYAVFRSPMFLMVMSTLLLNAAAMPFYQLAWRRSGSSAIGLIVAAAWLLLPSLTRLPYSNTYGFQSIYLAVPWLAWCFSAALAGRWRTSHLCLAAALLCEETVCGVAFGWGAYLLLFGGRRRDGLIIVVGSLLYLALCTEVIIPYFAAEGTYTRKQLFGEGFSLQVAVERLLTRERALYYLLALATPIAAGLYHGRRLAIAAVPTLALVLLMENADYLSLKGWHHSTILVVLFTAAVCGTTGDRTAAVAAAPSSDAGAPPDAPSKQAASPSCGPVIGLLLGALWMHWLLGASPITQSWRVHAATVLFDQPDPRMPVVEEIRTRFSPEGYMVIATERMAAHFTDYRIVQPAGRDIRFDSLPAARFLIVFDHSDAWSPLNNPATPVEDRGDAWLNRARAAGFTPVLRRGAIEVLVKRP